MPMPLDKINRKTMEIETMLGTNFLPTSSFIEAFKDEAQKIINTEKKYQILILDVLDAIASCCKELLSRKQKTEEQIKLALDEILKCPVWSDAGLWDELASLSISEIVTKIDDWATTNHNWEKASNKIVKQANIKPSAKDLEKALNVVKSLELEGSEKQVKWAKNIALDNLKYVAACISKDVKISTSAKWWIENRNYLKDCPC